MKCDRCNNEATIHEVVIHKGRKIDRRLCERCASAMGLEPVQSAPIQELLQKYVLAPSPPPTQLVKAEKGIVCPECKTSYGQFRSTGLLGCPACYAAFEGKLTPVLERAHEGAARHVGKAPRRALARVRSAGDRRELEAILGDIEERARQIRQLRDQLALAVKAEQYERAAAIRDDLRRLTEGDEGGAEEAESPRASAEGGKPHGEGAEA
jgi:protein arginine kinase activator